MSGEPQGPPPLLPWAAAGVSAWFVALGWIVSPWLSLAGAVALTILLLRGLEAANRGR